MTLRKISLREEVYERLRSHKREGESFSDVIERLTECESDVWAGYGTLREVDGFREAVADGRNGFDGDYRERQRRLTDK
jgi:predicted CopG family antitoxin